MTITRSPTTTERSSGPSRSPARMPRDAGDERRQAVARRRPAAPRTDGGRSSRAGTTAYEPSGSRQERHGEPAAQPDRGGRRPIGQVHRHDSRDPWRRPDPAAATRRATRRGGPRPPRTMTRRSPADRRPVPSRRAAQSRGDDGPAADRPVHARVGVRPDEQLHRHRRRPAQARPHRRLRRRGIVGRPARAARLRRGPGGPARRRPSRTRRPPRTPASSGRTSSATPRPEFRKPTIEQLATFMQPTWQALIDGAKYCEPQLREIIARQRPDVIVEDNVVAFPALQTAGRPFVRIVSCNPLEIRGAGRRRRRIPACRSTTGPSGRPSARSTTGPTAPPGRTSTPGAASTGTAPLPELEFIHASRDLNLYVYPEVADYTDRRPLDATWRRLDSSVRATDGDFELPPELANRPAGSALVYLSLGSLGSADVDLMRRLVAVLADTPHRYIVSKGPQHADYELAPNMWGAEFLPQTKIVPARRSRDHPRRQQHDDRGVPLRQADGRAAAVLGPVRQRPAGRRDRLRRPARDVRVRGRRAARGDRAAPRRRRRWAAGWRPERSGDPGTRRGREGRGRRSSPWGWRLDDGGHGRRQLGRAACARFAPPATSRRSARAARCPAWSRPTTTGCTS